MESSQSEKRKATFTECVSAAASADEHTLTVHMWEYWQGKHGDSAVAKSGVAAIDEAKLRARHSEVAQTLSVMANEDGASYTDCGFLHVDVNAALPPERKEHFGSRHQKGSEAGIVGLATTPLSSDVAILPFDLNSKTGLLMKDAVPVSVVPHDAWSSYYDSADNMPCDKAWDEVIGFINSHTPEAFRAPFAHSYFQENPDARAELVGKLAIMRRINSHPLDAITESQMPADGKRYALLDPFSAQVQERARAAYTALIERLTDDPSPLETFKHPEVNVNATLDNIQGVLVYNDTGKPYSAECSIGADLENNVELAKSLYRGLQEYNQISDAFRKHAIKHEPTIVIYQPHERGRSFVHAEPTKELRAHVEDILARHGELPRRIESLTPIERSVRCASSERMCLNAQNTAMVG